MKCRFISFLLLVSLFSQAQSLIVGIPSADVAEKHHLEITHESQWNFWEDGMKWSSFNFACYGIGHHTELTAALNNLKNDGSTNLALGLGAKKVFPILKNFTSLKEIKLTAGSNFLYSVNKKDPGIWLYSHASFRLPNVHTQFTVGGSYGTYQAFGFRRFLVNGEQQSEPRDPFALMLGFEQPLTKHISLIGDWFSGTHDLAAFTLPCKSI